MQIIKPSFLKMYARQFFICIASAMMFLTAPVSYAVDSSNPVALLQYVANQMVSGLKANEVTLKTNPRVAYQLAYKYVVPHADLSEMSKRVLPPQTWRQATPAQRARFQKLFTDTLIHTYASALASYKDQVVKVYPIRGGYQGKNSVEVSSEIESNEGDPIHVTYQLIRVGGSWKLVDMSVEGVSMLDSFRSQFSDIIASGNMEQLLNRLSKHNG